MMKLRNNTFGDQAGFTLVEMMVGLSLSAVAAIVVFNMFFSTQNSFRDTREIVDNQADARVAMSLIAQDIRSAGADLTEVGVQRLALCTGDTIHVQSDLDGDGMIDFGSEPPEDVTWFYDQANETLMRRTTSGDLPIARRISFFGMNYLDASGNELDTFPLSRNDRAAVAAVQFFMTVRINDETERQRALTVLLRNPDSGV